MRNYRERLRAPALWWVLGFITMVPLASLAWGGFSLVVGIVSYVVLVGGPGVALALWGRATIEVTGTELRAGRTTLPLDRVGHIQALDRDQTAKLRGPEADPAAFMLLRGFLYEAVYVEVTGDDAAWPYWLLGTRHPEELAAAIGQSRPTAQPADATMA